MVWVRAVVAWMLVLLFVPLASGHASGGIIENQDNRYDVGPYPGLVGYPGSLFGPMDILNIELYKDGDDLVLQGLLDEQPPRASDLDPTYRYWLGFHVRTPTGELQVMDVRVHQHPYATGGLYGPNAFGNPLLSTFNIAWNAGQMKVQFPIEPIAQMYGSSNIAFGGPEMQTDGPHQKDGFQVGTMVDYNFWEYDFEPLP